MRRSGGLTKAERVVERLLGCTHDEPEGYWICEQEGCHRQFCGKRCGQEARRNANGERVKGRAGMFLCARHADGV